MPAPQNMKSYSKDGVEMMEVRSIDLAGNALVLKGKMMGSMAATIHVQPGDMWKAFLLFPSRVKLCMPLLLKGCRQVRGETK